MYLLGPRWRSLVIAIVAVAAVWAAAVTAYLISKRAQPTAEKVSAYVDSVDLSRLSGEERAKALQRLADMLNKLSIEERRQARLERAAMRWFDKMTEVEKGEFIERTMPTGFKQMLTAFEELPEEKRRKTIDDALRRLREQGGNTQRRGGTNDPVLSPELEGRVRTIGLQTFYSQSSAQTKAELAPLLEELQRLMESGRPFRGR